LRGHAEGLHVLTLTATPIPLTLQSALAGLQDLSVIATPPVQRLPIRTAVAPFDAAVVRDLLIREHRRGGQSFFVCPRIEDIEPMTARLREIVPELHMVTAHGKMPADEMDEAMVRFADGDGDLLLATNVVESGLDVPRANTMLVWRADRFGSAVTPRAPPTADALAKLGAASIEVRWSADRFILPHGGVPPVERAVLASKFLDLLIGAGPADR
jgi:transcription-repair coupling factor (superfamily II helicase)